MQQRDRDKVMRMFKKGTLQYLISTDVSARGIDVNNLAFVMHHQLPENLEYYTHRSGRTARAGKEGVAITFASEVEHYHIGKIEELIGQEIKLLKIPKEVELLDTSYEEKQAFAREIDRQKRKEDPTYQGAFHDRKKSALKNPNKANHKTIQAYKFIAEEGDKPKNKGKGRGKSKPKGPTPKRKGKR